VLSVQGWVEHESLEEIFSKRQNNRFVGIWDTSLKDMLMHKRCSSLSYQNCYFVDLFCLLPRIVYVLAIDALKSNMFLGAPYFFHTYSVGQFLLKGQTMRVYTRRHVFLGRSPHPRKTCADTHSSCLSRHT